MIEAEKIKEGLYQVTFDVVTPIYEKTGIDKDKIALFLANEFIKLLGI